MKRITLIFGLLIASNLIVKTQTPVPPPTTRPLPPSAEPTPRPERHGFSLGNPDAASPTRRSGRVEINTEAIRVALQGKVKNPANRNRQGLFIPPEAMEMPLSIEVKKWQVSGKPIKFVADYGTEARVYGPLKSRADRTTVGIQIPVGKKR